MRENLNLYAMEFLFYEKNRLGLFVPKAVVLWYLTLKKTWFYIFILNFIDQVLKKY